jgi:hypothetical protein
VGAAAAAEEEHFVELGGRHLFWDGPDRGARVQVAGLGEPGGLDLGLHHQLDLDPWRLGQPANLFQLLWRSGSDGWDQKCWSSCCSCAHFGPCQCLSKVSS